MYRIAAVGIAAALSAAASAGGTVMHTFDLGGQTSNGGFFDEFPTVQHDFGAAGTVVMVEFSVNYTAHHPSWASEVLIFVDGAADGLGDFIAVDAADYGAPDASGAYQFSDTLMTAIVSDGVVSVTLAEAFNDNAVDPDATFGSGSFVRVHFQAVPAPGALALFGAAGAVGLRRRR